MPASILSLTGLHHPFFKFFTYFCYFLFPQLLSWLLQLFCLVFFLLLSQLPNQVFDLTWRYSPSYLHLLFHHRLKLLSFYLQFFFFFFHHFLLLFQKFFAFLLQLAAKFFQHFFVGSDSGDELVLDVTEGFQGLGVGSFNDAPLCFQGCSSGSLSFFSCLILCFLGWVLLRRMLRMFLLRMLRRMIGWGGLRVLLWISHVVGVQR